MIMTDTGYYDQSYPPSLWTASTVTTVNPSTAAVGAAGFTITVTGTGFTPGSIISFDGDERTTTFVNSTRLTAPIGSPVAPARTVQVTVDSGGAASFIITAAAEEPTEPEPEAEPEVTFTAIPVDSPESTTES